MGILSQHDLQWMEDSVQEVIKAWMTKISIYSRLPIDKQPNYNKLMHEFTGDSYCIETTTDAERKDIVNNITNDPSNDTLQFGKSDDGTMLFALPNIILDADGKPLQYKPTLHDIVDINNSHLYYISSIRDRIGETLITIKRFNGHTPTIKKSDAGIVITNYDWSDSNG